MIIFAIVFGLVIGYHAPLTVVHNDCVSGDKDSCIAEKKVSIYK